MPNVTGFDAMEMLGSGLKGLKTQNNSNSRAELTGTGFSGGMTVKVWNTDSGPSSGTELERRTPGNRFGRVLREAQVHEHYFSQRQTDGDGECLGHGRGLAGLQQAGCRQPGTVKVAVE